MSENGNPLLQNLLDRLLAGLIGGPALNCRPHGSRQRLDLLALAKLEDTAPADVLRGLLADSGKCKLTARVPAITAKKTHASLDETIDDPAHRKWNEQHLVLHKLRSIAEDAATYEQDTGVHVLSIGYPLLRLPAGHAGGKRRVLAPIAFIPVSIAIKGVTTKTVEISRVGAGADLVQPNVALLAWLEQMKVSTGVNLDPDNEGVNPWGEIAATVQEVLKALQLQTPSPFDNDTLPLSLPLQVAPRADSDETPGLVPSAIIGLYPMANQGLIRDMRALTAAPPPPGPIEAFLKAGVPLAEDPAAGQHRARLIADADPCQTRAVRLARACRGLVVHGPPGTGKSQTITNIIGDHLARGERVLFVSDKRTALDVVYNRLDHLGLGRLCAVVHDPQRDQRDLYKSVRAQLEELPEQKTRADAETKLLKAEQELARLHDDLEAYRSAVMDSPREGALSLHHLVGQWLDLPDSPVDLPPTTTDLTLHDYDTHTLILGESLRRATAIHWADHPWRNATHLGLDDFLQIPLPDLRRSIEAAAASAVATDQTASPSIPPFDGSQPIKAQGKAREELLTRLQNALKAPADIRAHWHTKDTAALRRGLQQIEQAKPLLGKLREAPLDAELGAAAHGHLPVIAAIGQQTAALDEYLAVSKKWYAFLAFKKKKAALAVITPYGLPLSPENASRVRAFLQDLRGRLVLTQLYHDVAAKPPAVSLIADDELDRSLIGHDEIITLLSWLETQPTLAALMPTVRRSLVSEPAAANLIAGLAASTARAAALEDTAEKLAAIRPLSESWIRAAFTNLLTGQPVSPLVTPLRDRAATLEDVIRVRTALDQMPPPLAAAARALANASVDPELSLSVLHKAVLAGEISRRLAANPHLHTADDRRLRETFDRYRALSNECRPLTRDAILHTWTARQKSRLLAATGSRVNSLGAKLRGRFMLQGERAMRLRRVIEVGQTDEGGDPLFDLRPVWMASPETVAQLFPRQPLFDLVVFDEASQCRLEEALPILTRASRVLIAGDPHQLPPSRFFESTTVVSDGAEPKTDQDLFELLQANTEDLLSAAVKLEIQEAYLDVHYRSRNADLIEFSNQHFYKGRLNAIPTYPNNRLRYPPISLHPVDGTYAESLNEKEAEYVCKIVRDLLRRAEPPSIGIACFNVNQRDLILDKLDELSASDAEFARRLQIARRRVGKDSFEGLFVKNLENVQGDERDHIIISTTYGPNAQNRFYRHFGPLGRAGGGRRLNVLATRARDEVHLVTSIPRETYTSLPTIPEGKSPTGSWYLLSYLKFAEDLAAMYGAVTTSNEKNTDNNSDLGEAADGPDLTDPPPKPAPSLPNPEVNIRPADPESPFAKAVAQKLKTTYSQSSTVHWGNDGFAIDIALHHPQKPGDVTLGILTDFTRYQAADDPIEWDLFRTAIHQSQGWTLHRLWTPHLFRDPEAALQTIQKSATHLLAQESPDPDLPPQK